MHDMLISRKQLLESTSGHPVPVPLAVQKLEARTFVLGRSVKQRLATNGKDIASEGK